jgi:predicted 3-demethylubiquinone-9 3-methyltransferase (glyoxalase superfamily)
MRISTFLMFQGDAEAWLDLAVAAIPGSSVTSITRYGAEGPGAEGSVAASEALIGGHAVRCYDSFVVHDFTFTPSISLFVDLDSVGQHALAHDLLADGGSMLMPPGDYGFSRWFSWIQDRYGVSWQLNVP